MSVSSSSIPGLLDNLPCAEHRPTLLTHQRPDNSELSKAEIPLSTSHLLEAAQLTGLQRPELDLSHEYSLYDGQQVELRDTTSTTADTLTRQISLSADMRPRRQLGACCSAMRGQSQLRGVQVVWTWPCYPDQLMLPVSTYL